VKMKRDMLVKTTFHTECVPETWEEVEEFWSYTWLYKTKIQQFKITEINEYTMFRDWTETDYHT
jgi:hypothetical protein